MLKIVGFLLALSVFVVTVVGWIMNLMAVINLANTNAPVNSMFVLRVVGIFLAPLGAVLGWFY